jgi:hypothetical protein
MSKVVRREGPSFVFTRILVLGPSSAPPKNSKPAVELLRIISTVRHGGLIL